MPSRVKNTHTQVKNHCVIESTWMKVYNDWMLSHRPHDDVGLIFTSLWILQDFKVIFEN